MREISILRINSETLSVLNLLEHVSLATKGLKTYQACNIAAFNTHEINIE